MDSTPRPAQSTPRRLRTDARGTTIMEFGLVVPILAGLMFGIFDFGHTLYMQAVLQGAVQKAARDSSLESADVTGATAAIDANVQTQIQTLDKYATVTITRRYYRSFTAAAAATAESFTDSNGNGTCDGPSGGTPGESYVDANNNGVWDQDGGDSGQGGARDIAVYKVAVSYPRMFPVDKLIGGSGTTSFSAQTVLQNQPFGDQATYGAPTVRQCTGS